MIQKAIAIIDEKLEDGVGSFIPTRLPGPIKLKGPPTTNPQVPAMIDDGLDMRGKSSRLTSDGAVAELFELRLM